MFFFFNPSVKKDSKFKIGVRGDVQKQNCKKKLQAKQQKLLSEMS